MMEKRWWAAILVVAWSMAALGAPLQAKEESNDAGSATKSNSPDTGAAGDAGATSTAESLEAVKKELDAVKAIAEEGQLAGHNSWLLTSSALVLFMTTPGLAMFYGGLVRRKNVLGVIMQCVFLMGLMTVIWGLWGYSLAFGGDPTAPVESHYNPYTGTDQHALMKDVSPTWDESTRSPFYPMEGKVPRLTHMLFQGMFFIITPALICGAFAERMKFSTMVVFMTLWGTLVYCPVCHWVWDGGILAYVKDAALEKHEGFGLAGGALDFAGGTVVHISSGVSALVCALVLGKRLGFGSMDLRPHNLTYTALGAGMLWVGWFGFNGGSALEANRLASAAFTTTHFAAAAGAIAWSLVEWWRRGKPSVLGACSGLVAGLVCITPASGYVQPMWALAMGAIAGCICYWSCSTLKSTFGYDDSLDAFGVHGVGGTLGAILTGVFATRVINDMNDGNPVGVVDGTMRLLTGQLVATGITWVYAIVVTFVLLKVLDLTMGLRVSQQDETVGLDISQHGEEGYIHV